MWPQLEHCAIALTGLIRQTVNLLLFLRHSILGRATTPCAARLRQTSCRVHKTRATFLTLPTEIRNEIYGIIAIPNTTPLSEYHGLHSSCRQIKAELEGETSRVLSACFARMTGNTPGFQIITLSTLPAPLRLCVTLDRIVLPWRRSIDAPFSLHPLCTGEFLYCEGPLAGVFSLYTESVTLSFGGPCPARPITADARRARRRNNDWLLTVFAHYSMLARTRRVNIELNSIDSWIHGGFRARLDLLALRVPGWRCVSGDERHTTLLMERRSSNGVC